MSLPGTASKSLIALLAILLAEGRASTADRPAAGGPVTLVAESGPLAKLYVSPDDLKPVEKTVKQKTVFESNALSRAVADLNAHLLRMTGFPLEVVQESDPAKIGTPALVIGSLAGRLGGAAPETRWQEGYRILTKDGRVLIHGERPDAAVYGIYAFLGRLGCDWVMPGRLGEIVPRRLPLAVPPTDAASAPDFALRWMWIGGAPKHFPPAQRAEFELWRTRQRMGYARDYRHRVSEAHMWQAVVMKYKDEFAKQPELLALARLPDGRLERRGPQLETANPKTVDLVVRYLKERFEEQGWPKDEKVTLAVGPADGLDFSESPESIAAGVARQDPIIGGADVTDLVVKLANDVLDRIGAEYPNLTLGYYVYSVHGQFPARYTPNPRVYPIFAPISYSRLHSTVDPRSKTRAYYKHVVEQWSDLAKKQGNQLMVYEYNWNLADNLLPFTRLRMVGEDLPFYKEMGLFGITVQAIQAWAINAPHDYVYARMAWDSTLDWKALLKEFCEKAYGPAAPELERYYRRLADRQRDAGQEAGSYFSAPLIFDEAYMKAAAADVAAAQGKPGLSADQKDRVDAAAYGFGNLTMYLAWNKAMNAFDFPEANRVGDALQAAFDAAKAKNPHFIDRAGGIYIQRLLMQSAREALKYSSEPYRILYRIPDELPTLLDPTSSGEWMNIADPAITDAGWIRTRTWSSTWDAQGLGFCRAGSVWYRIRFAGPGAGAKDGVGLLLSAFEDEARVWVNGKPCGTSGIKFPQAAAFDLTDAVKAGEMNLLVIQVRRNSMANELGLGGLLRPGFVFTGPRVASAAPPAEEQRVLPGGEVEKVAAPAPAADPLFDMAAIIKDPVETSVLATETTNGVVYQVLEFTTRLTNGAPERIQGVYAFPEGGRKLPAVFWSMGGMAAASRSFPGLLASNGYACLAITLPHKLRNSFRIPYDARNPQSANMTLLARDQLRGITVLSQRPEVDPDRLAVAGASYGGVFATLIAGVDPRVKAGFSFFGAGHHALGTSLPQFQKMGTEEDVAAWNRTIDGAFRLKARAIPFMWGVAFNDHWFHFPAVAKTFEEAAGAGKRLVIMPFWQHGFPPAVDETLFRFLDTTPVAAHSRPAYNAPGEVQVKAEQGQVTASFGWAGSNTAAHAELVVSYGDMTPWLGWPHRAAFVFPAMIDGRTASATIPIPSRRLPLLVWGTLTDASGSLVSTPPRLVTTNDLAAFPVQPDAVLNCFMDGDLGEAAQYFYRSMNEPLAGQPDTAVKQGGAQSIRIDPPAGTNASAVLTIKLFHSVPGLAHRFSVFLKAEQPIPVSVSLTPVKPASWDTALVRQFVAKDARLAPLLANGTNAPAPIAVTTTIGPEWREVALEVPAPTAPVDGYRLDIGQAGEGRAAYWIDTLRMQPVWPE